MKSMFGLDNILGFLDVLRGLIEKQKDQLKEQITTLESYARIQEQMHVYFINTRDGVKRVLKIFSQHMINSIPSTSLNLSLTTTLLYNNALKSFQMTPHLKRR